MEGGGGAVEGGGQHWLIFFFVLELREFDYEFSGLDRTLTEWHSDTWST